MRPIVYPSNYSSISNRILVFPFLSPGMVYVFCLLLLLPSTSVAIDLRLIAGYDILLYLTAAPRTA